MDSDVSGVECGAKGQKILYTDERKVDDQNYVTGHLVDPRRKQGPYQPERVARLKSPAALYLDS